MDHKSPYPKIATWYSIYLKRLGASKTQRAQLYPVRIATKYRWGTTSCFTRVVDTPWHIVRWAAAFFLVEEFFLGEVGGGLFYNNVPYYTQGAIPTAAPRPDKRRRPSLSLVAGAFPISARAGHLERVDPRVGHVRGDHPGRLLRDVRH